MHTNEMNMAFTADSVKIILDARLYTVSGEPARKHKKRRIQKKWLKRYGLKKIPDTNLYFVEGNTVIMHPAMYEQLEMALGEKTLADTLKKMSKEHQKKEEARNGNV